MPTESRLSNAILLLIDCGAKPLIGIRPREQQDDKPSTRPTEYCYRCRAVGGRAIVVT